MHTATNAPLTTGEHQVLFFESHFTEFKIGVAPNTTYLQWHVGGQPYYGVPFTAGTVGDISLYDIEIVR
jgi:hypothetical protein